MKNGRRKQKFVCFTGRFKGRSSCYSSLGNINDTRFIGDTLQGLQKTVKNKTFCYYHIVTDLNVLMYSYVRDTGSSATRL